MAAGAIATERSPSFSLPLRFFLLGVVGYLGATILLAIAGGELATGTTWTPHLLALTHLMTLGCVLPMIMGATFQLVSVVLLAPVWSEPLGKLTFWPFVLGVPLMVGAFWAWIPPLLALGGGLVLVGLALFLANLLMTLLRGVVWSPVGVALVISLSALCLAALLGGDRILAFNGIPAGGLTGVLPAHAHLAAFGGASLLIFEVSYRLIPMFAVSPEIERLGRLVLGLGLAGGVAVATGSLLAAHWLVLAGAGLSALSAGCWAFDAWRMFRARTRRKLDTGLTYVASAAVYLLVATGFGLAVAWGAPGRFTAVYALAGLVGWIGFSIVGQFHKILPFLSWYHRYSTLVGKRKVPLIRDLYDERVAWLGFGLSHAGLACAIVGLLVQQGAMVQAGGGLLAVGALAIASMVVQVLTR